MNNPSSNTETTGSLDKVRVLILDSNPLQAEVYSGFVQEVSSVVIDIVGTSDLAFAKLSSTNYQICIFDSSGINDNIGILERMRGINPNMSILYISERANIDEAVNVMKRGAEDYFSKPVNPDTFKLGISRALNKRDLIKGDSQAVSFVNLINACQLISSTLDEQRVFEALLNYLKRETECTGQAVYRKVNESSWERIPTSSDAEVDVIDVALDWNKVFSTTIHQSVNCSFLPGSTVSPSLMIFWFKWAPQDRVHCMVCLNPKSKKEPDYIFSLYKILEVQLRLAAKNIQTYSQVRELLFKDEATSLHNARFLNMTLEKTFETQKKTGEKFAILFVDLDHFKKVNDTYGHLSGTKLLYDVGECLKAEVRGGDAVCRYGGDEFVVILRRVDLETAREIAERIRANVAGHEFLTVDSKKMRLTVSIGVAICPDHASTKEAVVTAADHAMYVAKKSSRNMVYVYIPGDDDRVLDNTVKPPKAA